MRGGGGGAEFYPKNLSGRYKCGPEIWVKIKSKIKCWNNIKKYFKDKYNIIQKFKRVKEYPVPETRGEAKGGYALGARLEVKERAE